eukprot:scaffold3791_cov390-Prasinococcus_capsulatus_cf.AAC.13
MISIVPTFRYDKKLEMLRGDREPMRPNFETEVPLWMALSLRKAQRCRIVPPLWMDRKNLEDVLDFERNMDQHHELPFHYYEIASMLFRGAKEDIDEVYHTRKLIEDIRSVRYHKVRKGLAALDNYTQAVELSNLCALELNVIRKFFCGALDLYKKYDVEVSAGKENARPSSQQPEDAERRQLRRR